MLWFVGTGVSGYGSISVEGLEVLECADTVYLEQFTSPIGAADIRRIRGRVKGEFKTAKRWMVEDGGEILRNAREGTVVLLSYGDPYVATTHAELRTRAAREKILTRTVHGSSAVTSVVGECGLHHYKVGRVATVMEDPGSAATPYWIIHRNLVAGSHTVLLLEYDQERDFFLDPGAALSRLLDAEGGQRRGVIGPDTFAVVASRVGSDGQRIVSGRVSRLKETGFGEGPHAIIVPGRLHFTETDALRALTECMDGPEDNSDAAKSIPAQMIERYVPMVREALKEVAPRCRGSAELESVLENAELYIRDAERFLQEDGKEDVAVLCIGYADGLVDALRIAKGMDPKM